MSSAQREKGELVGFLVPEEVMADLKRIRAGFTPEQLAYDGPCLRDDDYEPNELWPDDEPFVPQPLTAKAESSPELDRAFSEWFLAGPMGGRLS